MTPRDARRPALTRDLLNPRRPLFFTWNQVRRFFTISAIADFDDAARREATANANQTRVDERKSSYSQYLRVRVVVRAPSTPRRDVKVRCYGFFGPFTTSNYLLTGQPSFADLERRRRWTIQRYTTSEAHVCCIYNAVLYTKEHKGCDCSWVTEIWDEQWSRHV